MVNGLGEATGAKVLRQQSALEFLVTYSWAFLIILLVLGIVFVLSGSSPAQYLPTQCSIQPLLECQATLLTSSPIQYKVLIINNLAPYLYFPANSFIVTATNLGMSGTNNYTGTCGPTLSAKGSEVVCNALIPGTLAPSVGTALGVTFALKYQICSNANALGCPSSVYASTGYATQSVSLASSALYTLSIASNVNAIISINNQRFTSGSSIYLPLGKYPAFAVSPQGYTFSSWATQNAVSVASASSQNTVITLTGNAVLTANFISQATVPTTIPTTVPPTTTIDYNYAYSSYFTSTGNAVTLTLTPGYSWYFCVATVESGYVSQSWIVTAASGTGSIGYQSSNVCSTQGTDGSDSGALLGIAVSAPGVPTFRTVPTSTSGDNLVYNVIDSGQYTLIIAQNPYTSEVPGPLAGCSELYQSSGNLNPGVNGFGMYLFLCSDQSPGSYTLTNGAYGPYAGYSVG